MPRIFVGLSLRTRQNWCNIGWSRTMQFHPKVVKMMPEATAICIIHHSPEQAAKLARQFESCTHVEARLADIQLTAADYADIVATSDVGAVIIDQYLDPGSVLGYTGIDVAEYLRRLRPGLPLYLLAHGEQDLAGREAVVEDVILEDEFLQRCPVYAVRILRAMGRYLEAMAERDRRYRELVACKLDGALSRSEENELAAYRAEIELPFAGSAIEYTKTWEQSLDEERKLLDQFKNELQDLLSKLT